MEVEKSLLFGALLQDGENTAVNGCKADLHPNNTFHLFSMQSKK